MKENIQYLINKYELEIKEIKIRKMEYVKSVGGYIKMYDLPRDKKLEYNTMLVRIDILERAAQDFKWLIGQEK